MATTLRRSLQTFALLIGIIAFFQVFFLVGKFMAIQLKPYLNAENVSTANNHVEGSYFNFNNNNANNADDDDDNNDYYYTRQNNNKSITPKSPACHPHFRLALPGNQWTNKVKFKRIYLYHLRKAGGSSLHVYFAKVAARHGLDFKVVEWSAMEEPGSLEDAETFYVTHIREPVDRAISHFKYEGRWNCQNQLMQPSFIPNEENAKKIETWNQTGGHTPFECHTKRTGTPGVRNSIFYLSSCAVNCYTQWFSGLSCSAWNISSMQQYKVAKERVLRYNMVVVIEKLRDPKYAKSIERFFGVRGITQRGTPWCEKESHAANKKVPLVVQNDTRESLTHLNELDVQLYHELSDCLDEDDGRYDFPKWNPNRFALNSFNVTKELELYINCVNETGKEGACKREHIFALKHPHNY